MFAQLRNGEKGQVCKNQVIAEKATTPPVLLGAGLTNKARNEFSNNMMFPQISDGISLLFFMPIMV